MFDGTLGVHLKCCISEHKVKLFWGCTEEILEIKNFVNAISSDLTVEIYVNSMAVRTSIKEERGGGTST